MNICPACNAEYRADIAECTDCRVPLTAATHDEWEERSKLNGVRGWLAWLSVALLIAPFLNGYAVIDSLVFLARFTLADVWSNYFGGLVQFVALDLAHTIVFSLFFSVAGWALLQRKSFAVRIAKSALALNCLTAIGLVVFAGTRAIPPQARSDLSPFIFRLIPAFIGGIVWYIYLATSERVRITFSHQERSRTSD